DYALFAKGPGQFPVTFFHPGKFFPKPVRLYVIDKGAARRKGYLIRTTKQISKKTRESFVDST
ncbi:hypothetical protein B1F69_05680, partial [Pseudomonas syringae]|uniref:hypothetical protein n=1 Tax=Pseudomonas syringae TaxID=317 RepID=UPI00102516EF